LKIGILGQGYVGSAIKVGFETHYKNISTFDKYNKSRCTVSSLKELTESSEVIFVCLPTPMKENGECDIGIVEKEIEKINKYSTHKKIVVIKSTVPPDTTKRINNNNKNIDVIFNPEFLTERNFIEDFKKQNRIVLGGNKKPVDTVQQVYTKVFPNTTIIKTDSTTAEMIKYFTNTFLATKVSFANEMKIICDQIDVNYDQVLEYSLYDKRLGKSHWAVPGPDNKLGFGGSCFPKDINALIYFSKQKGLDLDLLKSVWETNLKVRPEKDWENLKGRAVVKKG
jgi:UDPglucose 6-dehydrogenase|tara:strand:+ start:8489 stop:9334 length:846 start_codon:yes stop_codon:yes gene_type:complete